jgi:hypothetical protein
MGTMGNVNTAFAIVLGIGALAGCGDDGGSPGLDAAGSDAAGSGSDAGGSDAGGLTGGTFASPTDIVIGQNGGGSLAPLQNGVPQHFWRFTPATSAEHPITLTGQVGMSVNWCGSSASEGGCGCNIGGSPPYACCTIQESATSCTAITRPAVAAAAGIMVVYNLGVATGSYTVTIAAP